MFRRTEFVKSGMLMSIQHVIALTVSAFIGLSYTTAPIYCDDPLAQKNQVLTKALKIALEIEPLPMTQRQLLMTVMEALNRESMRAQK